MEVVNNKTEGWGIWYKGDRGYEPGFVHGANGYAIFGTQQAAQTECSTRGLSAAYRPRRMRITEIVEVLD